MAYQRPRGDHRFSAVERDVLDFWRDADVFHRSLESRRGGPRFVFYEGPPTANGLPHNGHVLTRVVKDLFPRYKAMRGFDVPRKAGWDTHGLPVEVEVEKELGIHGKAEIEAYGIEPFTRRCIDSVFRYTKEWEELTRRIGFWIDLPSAYVTFHKSYVESVWWALSELHRKGLLYRGHKVVWWWPQGGTALSSGEVGLGYKTVDDPAVVARFRSVARPGVSYLAWTTTPWTLPSNCALAVRADLEYVRARIERDGAREDVIVAAALVEKICGAEGVEIVERFPGSALVGEKYEPLFRYAAPEDGRAHEIIAADYVGAEEGTGIVHIAPAFGEDDFKACRAAGIGFLQLLGPDGKFPPEVTDFAGRFCKEADRDIVRHLKGRGLVFHEGSCRHEYPFCWRASSDPLIQYARPAWFIRTTDRIADAIANNRAVDWLPEHIKEGRFGDFLANNVDWALSRERYCGTPLPIWVCDKCGREEAISRLDDAVARNPRALDHWNKAVAADPTLSEHLVVHKPWVDEITFPCGCGGTMKRVPEVIDCWFDSGCMPFAQWGFPHQGAEEFRKAYPADFISEAIDQTRGWFYSLLMVATLVFDEETRKKHGLELPSPYPRPYKTCIVLGHVCDAEGKKESKSSGNYTPPDLVFEGKFSLTLAPARRVAKPPKADEAMLLPAQLKSLGLEPGARLVLGRTDDPSRTFSAKIVAGPVGKESIVLGDDVRAALGLEDGAQVVVHVLDDPPGADAFRWFFYSAGPVWNNTRNSLRAIREGQNEFLVRWQNVLQFFLIYASIDGFDPAAGNPARDGALPDFARGEGRRPAAERALLDRWILSETALAARRVTEALDGYRIYDGALALKEFVDGLSNWYVRRSRERFWAPGFEQDKKDAYWTLWEVLVALARLAAPFTPFFAEHTWRTLVGGAWPGARPDSVHLSDWFEPPADWADEPLSSAMGLAREVVSLGLAARGAQKLRVRQPLAHARVLLADPSREAELRGLAGIVADELNVKEVLFGGDADAFVHWSMQPNFRAIGPKYGTLVPKIKQALGKADAAALRRELDAEGKVTLRIDGTAVELGPEEIAISLAAREHYAAASSPRVVVVLETDLDDALLREGLARELVNRVQTMRKELDLDYAQRIALTFEGNEEVARVVAEHGAMIAAETLAVELRAAPPAPGADVKECDVDGRTVRIGLVKAATR